MSRDTTWFYNRKWGVSVHYLAQAVNTASHKNSYGKQTDWTECVSELNTDLLAEQLHNVGAGYLIFTMVQVSRFLAAPNDTFDRISGYMPGEACSKIDIVEKLYASLSKYDIDLILYFPCDGPTTDAKARDAFGSITYGEKNPHVTTEFVKKWCEVIKEYSLRYGKKVKGWWLDGCYYNIGYTDEKLAMLADACRAGNPDALVSSNLYGLIDDFKAIIDHVRRGCPSDDFTFGEMWNFKDLPYAPFVEHCRWHVWSSLNYKMRNEDFEDISYTADYMKKYVNKVHSLGGVVTMDCGIYRDGKLYPEHLEMMSKLSEIE
ncbi:MAG: alpha-L-fucosidase [Clostridia bacterium]|nr:alpha-L-fucosidase [Clostridia bacterium]